MNAKNWLLLFVALLLLGAVLGWGWRAASNRRTPSAPETVIVTPAPAAPHIDAPFRTDSGALYVLTRAHRLRRIPDVATLRALGFDGPVLSHYPDDMLAAWPLAPDFTRWLDSPDSSPALFYLANGQRRDVPDLETALAMDVDWLDVMPWETALTSELPQAEQPLPRATRTPDQIGHPRTTGAAWAQGCCGQA